MSSYGSRDAARAARRGASRRRGTLLALSGAVALIVAAGSGAEAGAASPPSLPRAVVNVPGALCGHGPFINNPFSPVSASVAHPTEPAPAMVGEEQVLDLDDPSALQSSGIGQVIGARTADWFPTFTAGHRYRVRARMAYGTTASHDAWGPWAGTTNLRVDVTPPDAPTLSSIDYPQDIMGAPAGLGSVTVTVPEGAIGFVYSWGGSISVGTCGDGDPFADVVRGHGRVSLPVPAVLAGSPVRLYAKAIDAAGQTSAQASYSLYAARPRSGALPGDDLTEGETAAVQTTALTYRHSVAGSSGHSERVVVATGAGQRVSLGVTAPVDGTYFLQLAGTVNDHSGTVNVRVDGVLQVYRGTQVPVAVDRYSPTTTREESRLTTVALTAGPHTVTLVTTTPNAASVDAVDHGVHDHGNSVAIDLLRLVWLV